MSPRFWVLANLFGMSVAAWGLAILAGMGIGTACGAVMKAVLE